MDVVDQSGIPSLRSQNSSLRRSRVSSSLPVWSPTISGKCAKHCHICSRGECVLCRHLLYIWCQACWWWIPRLLTAGDLLWSNEQAVTGTNNIMLVETTESKNTHEKHSLQLFPKFPVRKCYGIAFTVYPIQCHNQNPIWICKVEQMTFCISSVANVSPHVKCFLASYAVTLYCLILL